MSLPIASDCKKICQFMAHFPELFDARRPIFVARAPGRLDVMGGIGDYSGCLVLEMPIDCASWVFVQRRKDRKICIESLAAAKEGMRRDICLDLDELFPDGTPLSYAKARSLLNRDADTRWCAYVAGALFVLVHEGVIPEWKWGVNIGIAGDVPFGGGVSSSASVEMAVLFALCGLAGIRIGDGGIEPLRMAAIGQILENHIAGAPCGIMDQVTVTCGEKGTLLPILCRPVSIEPAIAIPRGLALVGIDTHVKHSIGGSRYTETRVATFMGHRIVCELLGRHKGDLYLGEISPEQWRRDLRHQIPAAMRGHEFIAHYKKSFDTVTKIDPDQLYRIRSRTEHPIHEQQRVEAFRALLAAYAQEPLRERAEWAGELMYAAHWAYGKRCGLGSPETDLLANWARELGPKHGIYGAKISGGGSGGTVAFLIDRRGKPAIRQLAQRYAQETGRKPNCFMGGSAGALQYGVHRIDVEQLKKA